MNLQFRVSFGNSRRNYFTRYHAEQFCHALTLNGTPHLLTRAGLEPPPEHWTDLNQCVSNAHAAILKATGSDH